MILDSVAALLIYAAIYAQKKKKEDTGSSLDNFGWSLLQAVLVGIAAIILKSNPFIW
jgi:hypothetical protein